MIGITIGYKEVNFHSCFAMEEIDEFVIWCDCGFGVSGTPNEKDEMYKAYRTHLPKVEKDKEKPISPYNKVINENSNINFKIQEVLEFLKNPLGVVNMTNTKSQHGPQFNTSIDCTGCSQLISLNTHSCSWTNEELNMSVVNLKIIPSVKCPYSMNSKIEYHKNEALKLEKIESDKLEKLLTNIFSGYDYSIDKYSGEIYIKIESELSLGQLKKFQEELPKYDLKIDSCDSDTIQIRITK